MDGTRWGPKSDRGRWSVRLVQLDDDSMLFVLLMRLKSRRLRDEEEGPYEQVKQTIKHHIL